MDDKLITEQLIRKIKDYANGRTSSVANGSETPRLAALLLQKYGYGVIDAVRVIYEETRTVDYGILFKVLDEEVEKIDPNWQENARERWSGEPADVVSFKGLNFTTPRIYTK